MASLMRLRDLAGAAVEAMGAARAAPVPRAAAARKSRREKFMVQGRRDVAVEMTGRGAWARFYRNGREVPAKFPRRVLAKRWGQRIQREELASPLFLAPIFCQRIPVLAEKKKSRIPPALMDDEGITTVARTALK